MAVSAPDLYSGYLLKTVASTILHGFEGVGQHLQNLFAYRNGPSAKRFVDVELVDEKMTVWADTHNAPSAEDMCKLCGSLGNKPGMVSQCGSNEQGHGGKAAISADADVAVVVGKAGDEITIGFPFTDLLITHMREHNLDLGGRKYDGSIVLNILVHLRRLADGSYAHAVPAGTHRPDYDYTVRWLERYLAAQAGSSLQEVCSRVADRLRDDNGLAVAYLVVKGDAFVNAAFSDGVRDDIVLRLRPDVRLSHEIARCFDLTALAGVAFRVNGSVVDAHHLCPAALPAAAEFEVAVEGRVKGTVRVRLVTEHSLPIPAGAIVWKYGTTLFQEPYLDAGVEGLQRYLKEKISFGTNLVDKKQRRLRPTALGQVLAVTGADGGKPKNMPWPELCDFVSNVCLYDDGKRRQGISLVRHVFGLGRSFFLVDTAGCFEPNTAKTALHNPAAAARQLLAEVLPHAWRRLASHLPEDLWKSYGGWLEQREAASAKAKAKAALEAAGGAEGDGGGGWPLAPKRPLEVAALDSPLISDRRGRAAKSKAQKTISLLAQGGEVRTADAAAPPAAKGAKAAKRKTTASPASDTLALRADVSTLRERVGELEAEAEAAREEAEAAAEEAAELRQELEALRAENEALLAENTSLRLAAGDME